MFLKKSVDQDTLNRRREEKEEEKELLVDWRHLCPQMTTNLPLCSFLSVDSHSCVRVWCLSEGKAFILVSKLYRVNVVEL